MFPTSNSIEIWVRAIHITPLTQSQICGGFAMTTTTQASQVSTEVDASPEKVWTALTTPEMLKKYFFGSDVDTDWNVESPIYFRGEYKGKKYEDKGEIVAFEPCKRLSFTHWSALSEMADTPENYHVVTFELTGSGDHTKVTLTQDNRQGAGDVDADSKEELEKNWSMVLAGLKKTAEGAK
jgi:uncharacterized protein YndB with AHSA1/START domain